MTDIKLMDEQQLDFWITEAMMTFGGSFVKLLGELYRRGDYTNRGKLKDTFENYWKEYKEIGLKLYEEDCCKA